MDIFGLLEIAKSKHASDVHLTVGTSPLIRVNGELIKLDDIHPLTEDQAMVAFMQITTHDGLEKFKNDHELDFKHILSDGTVIRCNAAQARGQLSLSIRLSVQILKSHPF